MKEVIQWFEIYKRYRLLLSSLLSAFLGPWRVQGFFFTLTSELFNGNSGRNGILLSHPLQYSHLCCFMDKVSKLCS